MARPEHAVDTDRAGHYPRKGNTMFAEPTPAGDTTAALIPWWGWAALAVAALAAAWWLMSRYGLPDFGNAADRIKRRSAAPAPLTMEAPAAPAPQLTTEKADTTASTGEAPPPPAPRRTASPRETKEPPTAPQEEAPAWATKALITIASVVTLLALPWAAWSVSQHLPVPNTVALPLGILFDAAMVGSVLVALLVPSVSRQASALGWVAASTAAVAIGAYTGLSGALIFATTPLISKALWGLLIIIRRQQAQQRASRMEAERLHREAEEEAERRKEEADREAQEARDAEEALKAAELSTELDHEMQAEVARLEREALYEQKLAAAKLKLEQARSEAEHQKALAEIERIGEQQRAEDRVEAEVYEQRIRLDRKLRTLQGQAPARLALEGVAEAELVPEVTATAVTNKAGFGSGFGFARPLDVKALTPEGASVRFEELPETYQGLVRYVHTAKADATVRKAARELDRDPRTIRRWKDELKDLGYELPIGK